MARKHKYTYWMAKTHVEECITLEEAPVGALFTAKEISKRFPTVLKYHHLTTYFSECMPMTTDDFYCFFGFRFEYGSLVYPCDMDSLGCCPKEVSDCSSCEPVAECWRSEHV